jgi:hypothetical protein
MDDKRRMYGDKPENLQATLGRMIQEAHIASNCDRNAANQRVREWLDNDQRFSQFDKDRLLAKANEAGATGGRLDWYDDYIYGGAPRPGR